MTARETVRAFIREEEENAAREESFFVCDGCGEAAAGEVCYAVELSSGSLRFCRECLREKRSLAEHLEMLGAEVRRCQGGVAGRDE